MSVALAAEGCRVALAGRRADALQATASQIREAGGEALVCPVDVTDEESVARLFSAVEAEYGRLDVLFNNAGAVALGTPIDELDYADWRRVINVNLSGAFLCTREAFRLMKRQRPKGGRIINNGSVSAQTPRPGSAAYTSSKHGLTGLTRASALDGREHTSLWGSWTSGTHALR